MTSNSVNVNLGYTPRPAFLPFHQRTKRYTVIVAHRRAGKTYSVIQDLVARALYFQKRDATGKVFNKPKFAYLCPYKSQAKQVGWQYLVDFTKNIPGVTKNETELWVEIPTVTGDKARIFLAGADNPDNLRGLYFDGVVLDEYGDIKPEVYSKVIRPALADRMGWVVFMGTPKGKNDFYKRVTKALENPNRYFYLLLKASTSGILSNSEIEEMKEEMEPEEWAQELECSFDAGFQGAFYGKAASIAEAQGKFRAFTSRDFVPGEKVCAAMDLGHTDAAVIWFWQVVDGEFRFFDYWEQSGYDAEEVCEMLTLKFTLDQYETIWLPHDARHHTFASKKSVQDTFQEWNLPVRIAPNPDAGRSVMHGIDAVRKFMRLFPFAIDTIKCQRGIEALKNYSRRYSRATNTFSNEPMHDEWSHGADAFRYAVLSIDEQDIGRSRSRATARLLASEGRSSPINTDPQTLNQMFAARERKMRIQRRDPGRAYE